ncbi:MAG: hypothetical protein ABIA12_02255 [Candidatus Aenigmatarchaeota archaeon]
MQNDVECPKCNSPAVRLTSGTHPVTYECADCGHGFVKGRNMLTEE